MLMTMDASLRAALAQAINVDGSRLEVSTETVPQAGGQPPSRDALVSRTIDSLERGDGTGALHAVVDLEAEALLGGILQGRADDVASVTSELVRLAAAVERAAERANSELDHVALAEARGAFSALIWTGRLAAEQLVGAALIADGSHAANMLAAIAELPGAANTDLEQELGTDKTQVSRTGRQLLDAGLATVSKAGTRNSWRATAKGLAALQARRGTERLRKGTVSHGEGTTRKPGSRETEDLRVEVRFFESDRPAGARSARGTSRSGR